jgi:hypothetical protein
MNRSSVDAKPRRELMLGIWLKRARSNKRINRSARIEFLMVSWVIVARPVILGVRPRWRTEMNRSAVDANSTRELMPGIWLKGARSNKRMNRSARIEFLIVSPVLTAHPVILGVRRRKSSAPCITFSDHPDFESFSLFAQILLIFF